MVLDQGKRVEEGNHKTLMEKQGAYAPWSTYNASKDEANFLPNQAEAVANALCEILEEQKRASRVLEQTVEAHPKWGAQTVNFCMKRSTASCVGRGNLTLWQKLRKRKFHPWTIKSSILNDYAIPDWKEMIAHLIQQRRIDAFHTNEDIAHAFLRGCTHWEKRTGSSMGKRDERIKQ